MPVGSSGIALFELDDQWLHRERRAALDIDSDGGLATLSEGVPIDAGVEWRALERCFWLRGEAILFLGASGIVVARRDSDSSAPVKGPFSADFRLVYLDGEDSPPIRCVKARRRSFALFGNSKATTAQRKT